MHLLSAILLILTSVQAAVAQCASPQDTFLSCTFSNGRKAVDVCVEGDKLTYRFGRVGSSPDLALSVSVIDAAYLPWPGIGRAIWERVTFQNQNTSYVVTGVIDRTYPEDESDEAQVDVRGMIEVVEGGETLAELECDAGSVDFAYGGSIYDAKIAANQCWNFDDKRWASCE